MAAGHNTHSIYHMNEHLARYSNHSTKDLESILYSENNADIHHDIYQTLLYRYIYYIDCYNQKILEYCKEKKSLEEIVKAIGVQTKDMLSDKFFFFKKARDWWHLYHFIKLNLDSPHNYGIGEQFRAEVKLICDTDFENNAMSACTHEVFLKETYLAIDPLFNSEDPHYKAIDDPPIIKSGTLKSICKRQQFTPGEPSSKIELIAFTELDELTNLANINKHKEASVTRVLFHLCGGYSEYVISPNVLKPFMERLDIDYYFESPLGLTSKVAKLIQVYLLLLPYYQPPGFYVKG